MTPVMYLLYLERTDRPGCFTPPRSTPPYLTSVTACAVASIVTTPSAHPEHTSQPPAQSLLPPPCSPRASAIIVRRHVVIAYVCVVDGGDRP